MALKKNITDFTLGADPEFMMLRRGTNEIVNAGQVCSEIREHSGLHEFGADGCSSTFEVRPVPSPNPITIVNTLHTIFLGHASRHPHLLQHRWQAGSHHAGYPIGGHIHFGLSQRKLGGKIASELLSNYVGVFSILLEDKEEGKKRRSNNYGGMSDHRIQSYGFEYRQPSSWLTSPYIAAGFLSLAKAVIWEAVNNPSADFNNYVVDSDFRNMNADKMQAKLPLVWKDIVKMHLYQEYKLYIDVLYHLATNRFNWYSKDGTMNTSWGLANMSAAIPKSFELNTIWARVKQQTSGQVEEYAKTIVSDEPEVNPLMPVLA